MGRRGKPSKAGLNYDPDPPSRIKRVRSLKIKKIVRDPGMADYIVDAEWWIARSRRTVCQIQSSLRRGQVACVLYERLGALVELGYTPSGKRLIAVQILDHDWAVDVSLEDLGVALEDIWDGTSEVDLTRY